MPWLVALTRNSQVVVKQRCDEPAVAFVVPAGGVVLVVVPIVCSQK